MKRAVFQLICQTLSDKYPLSRIRRNPYKLNNNLISRYQTA